MQEFIIILKSLILLGSIVVAIIAACSLYQKVNEKVDLDIEFRVEESTKK